MKTDDYATEHRTGLRCFAPFAVAVVALLSVSCATQVGMETAAFEGGPVSAVLEEHGDPDFRYSDDSDSVTYIAYRLRNLGWQIDRGGATNFRCSVIYTVSEDNVIASKLVGKTCHKGATLGRLKGLAGSAQGKDMRDVLMTFGTPDYGGLSGGTGTLVYDYGESSDSVAEDVGGGVSVSVALSIGCSVTIALKDGRVASAEVKGLFCGLRPI